MKMTIRELRMLVRRSLVEIGGGWAHPPQASTGDITAPDITRREALGRISVRDIDPDGLSPHLTDPEEDLEDCYGPVPPTAEEPYVGQDPFTRFSSPLPTPAIYK